MFSKKIFPILTSVILLSGIAYPALAINIWEGTGSNGVTCNQSSFASGTLIAPCDFCDALVVTKNVISYLTQLAFAVVVAMIVWGALQMIISAGSSEKFTHGKKGITDAITGLVVILSAWIIVNEFLHILNGEFDWKFWSELSC